MKLNAELKSTKLPAAPDGTEQRRNDLLCGPVTNMVRV